MKTNTFKNDGYCGLFCINCLPSKTNILCLNNPYRSDLERIHLGEFSLFKNQNRGEFVDYYRFLDELKAMIGFKYGDGLLPNQKTNGVKGYEYWQCNKKASRGNLRHAVDSNSTHDFHIDIIALPKMNAWYRKQKTQNV